MQAAPAWMEKKAGNKRQEREEDDGMATAEEDVEAESKRPRRKVKAKEGKPSSSAAPSGGPSPSTGGKITGGSGGGGGAAQSEMKTMKELLEMVAKLTLANTAELRDLSAMLTKVVLIPVDTNLGKTLSQAGRDFRALVTATPHSERKALGPPRAFILMKTLEVLVKEMPAGSDKDDLTSHWNNLVKLPPTDLGAQAQVLRVKNTHSKQHVKLVIKLINEQLHEKVLRIITQNFQGEMKTGPAPRGPLERMIASKVTWK